MFRTNHYAIGARETTYFKVDSINNCVHFICIVFKLFCNLDKNSLLGRIPVGVKIKVYNVFYTLIPSFIPDISLAKCFHVKIAHRITL